MYGEKGRIALIRPGVTPSTEMDFHLLLPEGVSVTTCGVEYGKVTLEGLQAMSDRVAACAAQFRGFPMDLVVFSCTTGSMVGGPGYDKRLIAQIEDTCGIPALTTTTALLTAFEVMGIKSLSVITPYSQALNEMEEVFLKAAGIEIKAIDGLGLVDVHDIPFVRSETMRDMALRQGVCGADALFISCTGICVLDIIEQLEEELCVPVLTSNQATIWNSLRLIGHMDRLTGLGQLGNI